MGGWAYRYMREALAGSTASTSVANTGRGAHKGHVFVPFTKCCREVWDARSACGPVYCTVPGGGTEGC